LIVTDMTEAAAERTSMAMATNAGAETLPGTSLPDDRMRKFAGIRALDEPPAGLPRAPPAWLEPPGRPAPPDAGAPAGAVEVCAEDDDVWLAAVVALDDDEVVVAGVTAWTLALALAADGVLAVCELPPHPAMSTGARASGTNRFSRGTGFRG
jgi:hypothetical protein